MVGVGDGAVEQLTDLPDARVEQAAWKPDAEVIAFSVWVDDRMSVYLKDLITGAIQRVPMEAVCCAVWLQR